MTRFAAVQASVGQPFFDAAPLALTELERLAECVGLPGSVVSQPTGIMSLRAAERFMVKLDQRIKHPTFFLESLQSVSSSRQASVANIALPRALTGIEAVEMVARRISAILHGASFLTERMGKRIWLLRTAGTTDYTDYWPVQQYNLEVALQSVQRVLGSPVTPCALRLSRLVPKTTMPESWRELPIELSGRTMGFAFDLCDIFTKNGEAVITTSGHSRADQQIEADLVSLRACLGAYLSSTTSECLSARMAKAFGMSERSYRRHLDSLGITHRQLVSDVRLLMAQQMLSDPSFSVTEIAFELGYNHLPAFTRFLKDRTGKSPQELRRQLIC